MSLHLLETWIAKLLDGVTGDITGTAYDLKWLGQWTTIEIRQTVTPTATVNIQYSFDNINFTSFVWGSFATTWTADTSLFTINAKIPFVRATVTGYSAWTIDVTIFSNTA